MDGTPVLRGFDNSGSQPGAILLHPPPQGLGQVWSLPLASSGWQPGKLLNILQLTGRPLQQRTLWPQIVEVENPDLYFRWEDRGASSTVYTAA